MTFIFEIVKRTVALAISHATREKIVVQTYQQLDAFVSSILSINNIILSILSINIHTIIW